MAEEKVVVFLDFANINRTAREKGYQLDYYNLLQYVGADRFLIDAHCYVPINPRNEHRRDREIEELWQSGYIVTTKVGTIAGNSYKCNFDVEITTDVLKAIHQVRPDIIVLASGDSDFVPLIQEVRKSGVRVEVAAFPEAAGAEVVLKCSGFIDLTVYYGDYLAAQNGEQDSIEKRFEDLIQSQNGQQDEDSTVAQDQDLTPPQEDNADEDDSKIPLDQEDDKAHVAMSDILDDLQL